MNFWPHFLSHLPNSWIWTFILQCVILMCLKFWDIGWIMLKKLKIHWMIFLICLITSWFEIGNGKKMLLSISFKYSYFKPIFNYIKKGFWKGTLIHLNYDTLVCFCPNLGILCLSILRKKDIGLMSVFVMFYVLSMEHMISGSCVTLSFLAKNNQKATLLTWMIMWLKN